MSDTEKKNRLTHAVRSNDFEQVKLLLRSGVDINGCDVYSKTPFQVAVNQKRPSFEMVKLLLER